MCSLIVIIIVCNYNTISLGIQVKYIIEIILINRHVHIHNISAEGVVVGFPNFAWAPNSQKY